MAITLSMIIASLQLASLLDAYSLPNDDVAIPSVFGGSPLAARFPRQQHPMKESGYSYTTHYFQQTLDHFNFRSADMFFKQRYLINDEHFESGAPVFFYTGNEGDITWFCNNTGFMWEIAPEFKAMLVFAEHRYYGTSLPFGKDSYQDASHLGFLTSGQALADFAVLIDHIKETIPSTKNSPFFAFGGSYGGMLAAWIRMKYPASIQGSIAASAPILAFPGMGNAEAFYAVVTNDFFEAGGESCTTSIRKSWNVLWSLAQTGSGLEELTHIFRLCKPLVTPVDSYKLTWWLSAAWTNLGMVDYPYPANFLEDLPAWPIKGVCKPLRDSSVTGWPLMNNIAEAARQYFNYTGQSECLDIDMQATGNLGDKGWDFQACTEMAMPLSMDGVNDMWNKYEFDFEAFALGCKKQWGVTTRKTWAQSFYGGKNLDGISNIVFSNGRLDPWKPFGVLNSTNEHITTVLIHDGAHHLDLRKSNVLDPQSVVDARNVHRAHLRKWTAEWRKCEM